ncbi:hypothetical protein DY926_09500 [Komagataeibacter melaceti]|uniref:Uncharacterized protein n=1 Tax=Komagataeibacter melaceti TaxID=2766577 RepID=A0A371YZY9_9PROT|nr:hypothetical protein DY926_09500 [Komagataeibacter melaceti]
MQARRCHHARAAHVWRRGAAGAVRLARCIGIHLPEAGRGVESGVENGMACLKCYNITSVYISALSGVKIKDSIVGRPPADHVPKPRG